MTVASRRVKHAVALAAILSLIAVRLMVLRADLPWRTELVLADVVTYLLPTAVCVVLALAIASRLRAEAAHERGFWIAVAIALTCVFVSESYWTWYAVSVDPYGLPFDSPARLLHAVALAVLFGRLVRMTRLGLMPATQRVRLYIDSLATMTIAWPAFFAWWTFPAIGHLERGGMFGAAVAALYPVFGTQLVVLTVVVAFASAGGARPVWEKAAAACVSLYGALLAVSPATFPALLTERVDGANWPTLAFGVAMMLLAVVMAYRLADERTIMSAEPWPVPRFVSGRLMRVYPVFLVLALAVLTWLAFEREARSEGPVLLMSVAALATLLTFRGWISALDRARLRLNAATDPATGVLTRQFLEKRLREVIEHSGEAGLPFSLIAFDIRALQPLFEPLRGRDEDAVAAAFARLVAAAVPSSPDVFRVSGERYAVVLEGAAEAEAAEAALAIWVASGDDTVLNDPASGTSVFAGVATFPEHGVEPGRLIAAAEVAVSAAHGVEGEPVVAFDEHVARISDQEHGARERIRVQRATVRALAEAVDARDPATRDHSTNVADLATALAQVLDLSDERVRLVGLGALMHDVGKIGVRDEVLLKATALTAEERAEIEEHTALGERILAPARLDEILPVVRWHHERWDGTGYPDGLQGEDIPLEARILAVCDAFETMTTGRPYHAARTLEEALAEVEAHAGTQFDPEIAAAFVRMVRALDPHPLVPAAGLASPEASSQR